MSLLEAFLLTPNGEASSSVLCGEYVPFDPLAMPTALKDSLSADPSIKGRHKVSLNSAKHIVRKYGKKNVAFRSGKCKYAQDKIEHFTQVAKITQLCQKQLLELHRDVLRLDDLEQATKCRFLCRIHALQDCNDVFNKLKAKRKRDLMHSLQTDNDTEISSPEVIMEYSQSLYSELLSEKKA
ncbi:hypothetical protein L7F22_064290 [Adiantum nelumboides]|nr:hypothetical protein [Adiantum nelumboides]